MRRDRWWNKRYLGFIPVHSFENLMKWSKNHLEMTWSVPFVWEYLSNHWIGFKSWSVCFWIHHNMLLDHVKRQYSPNKQIQLILIATKGTDQVKKAYWPSDLNINLILKIKLKAKCERKWYRRYLELILVDSSKNLMMLFKNQLKMTWLVHFFENNYLITGLVSRVEVWVFRYTIMCCWMV